MCTVSSNSSYILTLVDTIVAILTWLHTVLCCHLGEDLESVLHFQQPYCQKEGWLLAMCVMKSCYRWLL